ncbi:MAG TPA: hypothetical protein VLV32_04255 [Burkholderiales bacterium]|nr:hypothetical protein [Burkholderiales bacterium]
MKTKGYARRICAPALPQDADKEEFAEIVLDDEGEWDWIENLGNCSAKCAEQSVQPVGVIGQRFYLFGARIRTRRVH